MYKKYLANWEAHCVLGSPPPEAVFPLLCFPVLEAEGFPKRSPPVTFYTALQQTAWWLPSSM